MTVVRVAFRKWDGTPHWTYDARELGSDEHGAWLGAPAGTRVTRPGHAFDTTYAHLTLLVDGAWGVPTFYAAHPDAWCDVYVDVATPPERADGRVTAVDLDLDVVRGLDGRVWVDDEDEFAEHRVRYGYPADVVAAAERSAAELHAAVAAGRPPYDDGTPARWLRELDRPGS